MAIALKQNKAALGSLYIFILWLAYVSMALSWIGGSMLSNQVVDHFLNGNSNPVLAQMVNYTITFARAIANILAAYILLQLGPKRAVTLALLMVGFSLLAPITPNYWLYNITRMIMGLGGSMLMVYMNSIISNYIPQNKKVMASAISTVSYNFAAFLAALVFLVAGSYFYNNWEVALWCFGSFSVIALAMWIFFGENFIVKSVGEASKQDSYSNIIKLKFVWHYILTFTGFIFLFVFALTSLPVLMQNTFGANSAMVVFMVSVSGIIGTFVTIYNNKFNFKRKPIMHASGIIMVGSMALALYVATLGWLNVSYLLIFVSGFFMALQYPLLTNLVHEMPNFSIQKISIIVGYLWGFGYGLYTVLAITWSVIYKLSNITVGLIAYIVLSAVLYLFVLALPETKKQNK